MKVSLIAAKSENNIIGNDLDIPWQANGEQLLFKAITFNQWLLVGRKTFEKMGILPNRKYGVVSRSGFECDHPNVLVFSSIQSAMTELAKHTNHLVVSGGGEIYKNTIELADTIHISTIQQKVSGNIKFPEIPKYFRVVFEQDFESNINYKYQIWQKT